MRLDDDAVKSPKDMKGLLPKMELRGKWKTIVPVLLVLLPCSAFLKEGGITPESILRYCVVLLLILILIHIVTWILSQTGFLRFVGIVLGLLLLGSISIVLEIPKPLPEIIDSLTGRKARKAAREAEMKSDFWDFDLVMNTMEDLSVPVFTNALAILYRGKPLEGTNSLFYLFIGVVRTPLANYLTNFSTGFRERYGHWEHLPTSMQVEGAMEEMSSEWTRAGTNVPVQTNLTNAMRITKRWVFKSQSSFQHFTDTNSAQRYNL